MSRSSRSSKPFSSPKMSTKTTSPRPNNWQRPSGVIKLKVKKRRSVNKSGISTALKPINLNEEHRVVVPVKRKNPFGCSPKKRANVEQVARKEENNKLFRALSDKDKHDDIENVKPVEGNRLPTSAKVLTASDIQDPKTANGQIQNSSVNDPHTDEKVDYTTGTFFPIDWGLKTKVRFTSENTFSWSSSLKSLELAEGNSNFVRCTRSTLFPESEANAPDLDIARTELHRICKTWMHPSIPWLKLFPRSGQEKTGGKSKATNNVFIEEELAISLQAEWVASFHSVFNLLRCGYCPYFYLCANQCTMLFKAAGFANCESLNVVITPTTKGFRDALTNEGIEFTLPHATQVSTSSHDTSSDSEDELLDTEDHSEDESDWLESMGLNKEQLPTFEPHKLTSNQSAKMRTTDQNPGSTVLVQGADTQALFNFILNWKSITAKNGSLAGVPPTLLAPVAFEGAALRSLKINQGVVRHQKSKGLQQLYSLEVTGSLVPSMISDICSILNHTQQDGYTAIFMHHQSSTALNIPALVNEDSPGFNPEKFGLSLELSKYFQQSEALKKDCLKELNYKDGLYAWKTSS